jgi:succinoglycan biosynthesis transport protein ExoP
VRQASSTFQAAQDSLGQLKRESAATLQVYGHFLERYKQLTEQESLVQSDVQIVDAATPPDAPTSPSWLMFTLAGFVTSSIFGSMVAVATERGDRGIRSASDVHNVLGLIRIGLVPRLHRLGRVKPHQYLLNKPFSAYAEAMRSILAALRLSTVSSQAKILLVTSSVPGEGKTTLSISLAVSAKLAGQRAILIDMDFRRPSVARDIGIATQGGGIIEYLTGDQPLDEFIQQIDANIDCVPTHACKIDPMVLVGSKKVSDLLAELRARYDIVIIDSPPILGITEARMLAPLADAIIFVVKWGSTKWEVARSALSLLPSDRLHITGVVLTQMDQKKHKRYGYGDSGDYYQKYHKYFPEH